MYGDFGLIMESFPNVLATWRFIVIFGPPLTYIEEPTISPPPLKKSGDCSGEQ